MGIPATIMDLLADGKPGAFPGSSLITLWQSPKQQATWPYPVSELGQTGIIVPADRVAEGQIANATNGRSRSSGTPRRHLITHEKFAQQLDDWTDDPQGS